MPCLKVLSSQALCEQLQKVREGAGRVEDREIIVKRANITKFYI